MDSHTSKRLVTHSEDFHTDDVFATAMLLELFPDARVVRSRDESVIATGDIVYSSFGLLWREYGLQYCGGDKALWSAMDRQLAVPIDANDNGQKITTPTSEGVEPFTIDNIIAALNPQPWITPSEEYDAQFMKAVKLAGQILRRLRTAVKNELLYVVSPRPSGSWGVLAVSTGPGSYTPRRPFPESWRAQPPKKLAGLTGVPDAVFCHAAGFYAAVDSKAGAVALAGRALPAE